MTRGVTLDAGALIALDLDDRRVVALLARAKETSARVTIYRRCRQAGITPRGIVDCMIAAVAWRRGAALLAYDVDMDHVANVVGLDRRFFRSP